MYPPYESEMNIWLWSRFLFFLEIFKTLFIIIHFSEVSRWHFKAKLIKISINLALDLPVYNTHFILILHILPIF